MNNQEIESFSILGIAIRTTNENGQSGKGIPALWNKFMSEGILQKIPNRVDDTIYCVYTDYEKDYTRPYTTILGCKVLNLNTIPAGMTGKTINKENYSIHLAKGNLFQGIVFHEWTKIWNSNIKRAYTTDFEIYGEKAQDPENAEVEIFIAIQ